MPENSHSLVLNATAPVTETRRAKTEGLGAKHKGTIDEVEAPTVAAQGAAAGGLR